MGASKQQWINFTQSIYTHNDYLTFYFMQDVPSDIPMLVLPSGDEVDIDTFL